MEPTIEEIEKVRSKLSNINISCKPKEVLKLIDMVEKLFLSVEKPIEFAKGITYKTCKFRFERIASNEEFNILYLVGFTFKLVIRIPKNLFWDVKFEMEIGVPVDLPNVGMFSHYTHISSKIINPTEDDFEELTENLIVDYLRNGRIPTSKLVNDDLIILLGTSEQTYSVQVDGTFMLYCEQTMGGSKGDSSRRVSVSDHIKSYFI